MAQDIKKLPKWAQEMIVGLRRDLDEARAQFDNFVGTKPTKVKLDPDGASIRSGVYPRFLPERSSVEFALKAGEIETRLDEIQNELVVRVMATGNSQLVVEPESSNVVRLRLIPED
jgi:hypothetical protein